ncbi:2-C-methyl-D-erythritol 4-phosphate cytidylyltransferase [Amphibacillus marinus]|uniref:2-C-methyl-D-erythritol 4-phosphate cytidylyltransferase n=1 Tax=Amphibacillus marinus TaxID=872970 RepID=A0A1H8SG41_9BACI|nr:2-C-methyl-D-erythritol 4-phosphate cytidylyltransferase [Amphibacillus marinus]SEO77153.1 2-C-methyl-D-erythritol 4-phosphate cytidylyltransferase [Amphibacillus marinus]
MKPYNVIILAAGLGKRMGLGYNKQFIHLEGKPLLNHTLEAFERDRNCNKFYIVVRKAEEEQVKEMVAMASLKKPYQFVYGGQERQDSVYAGLCAIKDRSPLVFIHDGARPFISINALQRLNRSVSEHGAAILAVPVKDTVKQLRAENDHLITLDRSTLYLAQTPQAFDLQMIKHAHADACKAGYYGTDDASLVERLNQHVQLVEGESTNIKITTPDDLEQAAFILSLRVKEEEDKNVSNRTGL